MKYNVDIKAGDDFAAGLKNKFGVSLDFAAEIDLKRYKNPVLVTSTDGIGTKLDFLRHFYRYKTIGKDLVACVFNDIICHGAQPLGLMDYIATPSLNYHYQIGINEIIEGIVEACEESGAKLLGGETAEMNTLKSNQLELAGFGVGIRERVNKESIDVGKYLLSHPSSFAQMTPEPGDVLIGLPSDGVHSNGYTLIREICEKEQITLGMSYGDIECIIEELCKPTKNYVKQIMALKTLKMPIKRIAHITGGGLAANTSRIIPNGLKVSFDLNWEIPDIFNWIQKQSDMTNDEMYQTFNMGIGMVLVVNPKFADMIADGIQIGNVLE